MPYSGTLGSTLTPCLYFCSRSFDVQSGLKTTKTSKIEYLHHDTKLSIFLLRHKINTRFEVNLKNYFFISIEYDSHIPLNGSYAIARFLYRTVKF